MIAVAKSVVSSFNKKDLIFMIIELKNLRKE